MILYFCADDFAGSVIKYGLFNLASMLQDQIVLNCSRVVHAGPFEHHCIRSRIEFHGLEFFNPELPGFASTSFQMLRALRKSASSLRLSG